MAIVQRKFQGNNMISWGSQRVVATQQGTPGHMATSSSQTALEDPKLRCIHDDEVLGCPMMPQNVYFHCAPSAK